MRLFVLLLLTPCTFTQTDTKFDQAAAQRFADLALKCVHQEYPNKIAHTLNSDADVGPPRKLTPSFYGCYDWHSAVHGHWLLARLAREYPQAPFAAPARAALKRSITRENVAVEVAYLNAAGRASFERPYGLAWLLQLAAELREWGKSDLTTEARRHGENLNWQEAEATATPKPNAETRRSARRGRSNGNGNRNTKTQRGGAETRRSARRGRSNGNGNRKTKTQRGGAETRRSARQGRSKGNTNSNSNGNSNGNSNSTAKPESWGGECGGGGAGGDTASVGRGGGGAPEDVAAEALARGALGRAFAVGLRAGADARLCARRG